MPFCDADFLLSGPVAHDLYHRVAARQPIVDYHCHLSPQDIAEDRRFENLHAVWLAGDHYKWRAMRADGVAEELITGSATPHEKFRAWARTVPHTLRNPLFHWTHLELRRHFGIEDLLEESSADGIWQEANRQLATGYLTARGILTRMNVELVGTTDDPADLLDWHAAIKKSGFKTRVVPTFRPDAAARVDRPAALQTWVRRLSDIVGRGADSLFGLVAALEQRHADFAAAGCRASDHGILHLADADVTDAEAGHIYTRALAGTAATPMARVGEEFPLECPNCGGDIRLIAFITEPGPIRKILTHLGEPLEPPPVSPCRGPPTDWGELVQAHDDREAVQVSPDELPVIDIHGL